MSQRMIKSTSNKRTRSKNISPVMWMIILGGLLLLFAGFMLYPRDETVDPNYTPEITGGASLKVDKEQIDFGDVKLNQTVRATFLVTNVGDKTLKFAKDPFIEVKEGC